jgi:predicted alpha/beta superfamily hydrolase
MKFIACALCFLLLVVFSKNSSADFASVETFELTSKVFNNTRSIRILLPPDYRSRRNHQRYPVLYLNDGLMVFDSAGPGIRIESIVSDLYKRDRLPEMMIVGIDNGACTDKTKNEIVDRANEFLPYPDQGFAPANTYAPEPPEPQGKRYPRFLIHEVIPEINRRYRTKTSVSDTALGGFSYGGVSALYTVLSNPGVFGKLLLESTPLYIGRNHDLLRDAQRAKQWPLTIYIGSGTNETDEEPFNREGEKNLQMLASFINKNSPGTRLKVIRQEGGTHGTNAWRNRLPEALQFLFSSQ